MQNKLITNLCMISKDNKLLLGMKKRRFGEGKWNGYGGKVMEGESIEEALYREVMEEGGIEIKNPMKLGILNFHFPDTGLEIENHIYKVTEFVGEPIETEEMRPEWFSVNELPFDKMWKDDPYWINLLLTNKKFKGRFVFDKNEEILEKELMEVDSLV